MIVKREFVPFKEIIDFDPAGAKVFLDTFYPHESTERRANLFMHFTGSNLRLCDRDMGWAYENIRKLIDEFERLDRECPYDTSYSLDDVYSAELLERRSDEQYLTFSLYTKEHYFIGVKRLLKTSFADFDQTEWMQPPLSDGVDATFLYGIKAYLEAKGVEIDGSIAKSIADRKAGKRYTLSDHLRGLIYSLMTNQTEWSRIVPHLAEVDRVFMDYDVEKLKNASAEDLCQRLFDIKCGNRQSAAQMRALHENIATFERIVQEFGSMDAFVTSAPANEIVERLSTPGSVYKLKQVGAALAWEYLRNVGIDGAKPDTHLRRFFGGDRVGKGNHSPATEQEVIDTVAELSEQTGLSMAAIDNLVWTYCSDGYGEVCTAKPNCKECTIAKYCQKGR